MHVFQALTTATCCDMFQVCTLTQCEDGAVLSCGRLVGRFDCAGGLSADSVSSHVNAVNTELCQSACAMLRSILLITGVEHRSSCSVCSPAQWHVVRCVEKLSDSGWNRWSASSAVVRHLLVCRSASNYLPAVRLARPAAVVF